MNSVKQTCRTLYSKVSYLDAFGQQVHLYFQGHILYKTHIGAFLTMLVFLPVMSILIYDLIALFQRKTFSFSQEISYFMEPPSFNYNDENVIFAIGYVDQAAGVGLNNQVVDVSLFYTVITRYPNGTLVETDTPIPLHPCNIADFHDERLNDKKLIEGQYNRSTLDDFMCANNLDYEAYGDSDSPVYAFIHLEVSACVNGTNNFSTCATPDFIANYFATTSLLPMRLYLLNNALNLTSYDKPLAFFIDEIRWYLSPGNLNIYSDIFLRRATVITVSDYLGLGTGDNITALVYEQDRRDRFFSTPAPAPWLEVTLRPGNYVLTAYREYYTFGGVLGVVGGTLSILSHILGRAGRFINRRRYMAAIAEKMVNDLDMTHRTKDFKDITNDTDTDMVEAERSGVGRSESFKEESFLAKFMTIIKSTKNGICFFKSGTGKTRKVWNKGMAYVRKEIEIVDLLHRLRALEVKITEMSKSKEKKKTLEFRNPQHSTKRLSEDSQLLSATLASPGIKLRGSDTIERIELTETPFNLEMTIDDRVFSEEKRDVNVRVSPYK
jgi:hypothetical protein